MLRALIFLWACFAFQSAAFAQGADFRSIRFDDVIACPATSDRNQPPSFQDPDCEVINARAIDPQGRAIWIKAEVELPAIAGPDGEPLAVFISGKFSSLVYLNGKLIGSNGTPSLEAHQEQPGLMDAVVFAPQSAFSHGANEIILKASSHRGFLQLAHPVHWIGIGPAASPQQTIMAHYWPSLPTLGLFLLAMMYFVTTAISGRARAPSLALSAICAFATLQLLAELTRGMVAYTYPFHDMRLALIVAFSAGFGVSFAALVATMFARERLALLTIIAALLSIWAAIALEGYDQKAATAMFAPIALSVLLLSFWSFKGVARAWRYLLIGIAFLLANITFLSYFLDVVFFYALAAFMILLLTERAIHSAKETLRRKDAEALASRLELALEQAEQGEEPVEIAIRSNGRIDRVAAHDIVQIRSADGYVDIITKDGRELTHSESLSELEARLPVTFIRVHRSHLVNSSHVRSLRRSDQGNGFLVLANASEVPVSRRIMPSVRRALG